jgi:Holliday junction DNA helicase RuvA
MIGKLSGKVFCSGDNAIVDVAGVGYLVYCSTKNLANFVDGEYYQLFIETHVREDHIHLYGFLSIAEKNIFNMLLSVNGVGPRMALAILSVLNNEQIVVAICNQDKAMFQTISGIGPKLAARIIVELKDKIAKISVVENGNTNVIAINNGVVIDAISALTNLGINRAEAQNLVSNILATQPDLSIDELIKLALQTRHSH